MSRLSSDSDSVARSFSLRGLVVYWIVVTVTAGLIAGLAFDQVTVSSEALLGLYVMLLFLPVLYPIMMRLLPTLSELTVGEVNIQFRHIEERIEEQRERVEQISNSQQNSLHSLASLVIADPLRIPSYSTLVEERTRDRGELIVGSQEFTESELMCALITEMLRRGVGSGSESRIRSVTPRYDFGEANLNFIALSRADIDVYPGYTWQGFEMIFANALSGSASELAALDPEEAVERLNTLYGELPHPLTWLPPTGVTNDYVLAMEEEDAERRGIETISDLRGWQRQLTFGCDPDFFGRPNGFRLLGTGKPVGYGLVFRGKKFFDHEQIYDAHRSGEIDVFNAYSTDPELRGDRYRTLEDDRALFGTFHSSWVVRTNLLREMPEIGEVLTRAEGRLTNERVAKAVGRANRRSGRRAHRRTVEAQAGRIVEEVLAPDAERPD